MVCTSELPVFVVTHDLHHSAAEQLNQKSALQKLHKVELSRGGWSYIHTIAELSYIQCFPEPCSSPTLLIAAYEAANRTPE